MLMTNLLLPLLQLHLVFSFHSHFPRTSQHGNIVVKARSTTALSSSSSSGGDAAPPVETTASAAPVLNGKRVLPYKIMMGGLKGQTEQRRLPAVFATLNSSYRRGTDGWDAVTYVGVTQDIANTLQGLHDNDATELKVAHVRALSFTFPQPTAMNEVASQWRQQAIDAGAAIDDLWADNVLNYLFDEEDDDDEDDEDYMTSTLDAVGSMSNLGPVVSPFESSANGSSVATVGGGESLEFNAENVDVVLNEVRPYLIADGGNVKVERVVAEDQLVELKLEGACGSCASSTVTMQMGIERVLKEKWPGVTVTQVDDEADSQPKELGWAEVEKEVNRMKQALVAMGAVVELKSVDSSTGTVVMRFRGPDRVRQGLELAILDVPFVKTISFVDED